MPTQRRETPFALSWWMPVLAFLPAFLLRLVNFHLVRLAVDDSSLNVPNAAAFVKLGLLAPDNWWTPPLKHLTLFGSILLFGDDPVGWRLRSVLLGGLTVLLAFLLVREALLSQFTAWTTVVLLTLDPLSLLYARSTTEEVLAGALLVASLLVTLRALRPIVASGRSAGGLLLAAGALFGLALSARWFAVIPLVVTALFWLTRERISSSRTMAAATYFILVPVTVYAAVYLPWLLHGHSLVDLVGLHADGVRAQGFIDFANMDALKGPLRWLFGFILAGGSLWRSGGLASYSITMSNPPVWMLLTPALAWLAWGWRQARKPELALIAFTFVATYVFFVMSPRPIYLYSAVAVLPFALIVIADALAALPRGWRVVAVVLLALWSVYLYPLTSAIPVPPALYFGMLPS